MQLLKYLPDINILWPISSVNFVSEVRDSGERWISRCKGEGQMERK